MLVASLLLHTELHRAANRRPEYIGREAVSEVLSAIALVDIENGNLTTAPLPTGRLRSAGAIHLDTDCAWTPGRWLSMTPSCMPRLGGPTSTPSARGAN
jgi:hypothetical protein